MLQFYFRTFEYEVVLVYQESVLDFLCKSGLDLFRLELSSSVISAKVGGWIGLIVGASFISFLEFIYFAFLLVRNMTRRRKGGDEAKG